MIRLLALCICSPLLIPSYGLDIDSTYIKTEDGVTLSPKEEFSGNTQAIKIQVITDKIIRVIASPQKTLSATSSLLYRYDASIRPTWDNYSITQAGDTRNYKSLSAIKLFSKDGQTGWFTTTYCSKKNKPGGVLIQRVESEIKMGYINKSAVNLSKKEGIMCTCNGEKQIVQLK